MSQYKQGDIVMASVQFTDKKGAKVRPVLVISNTTLEGNHYGDILVCGFTTTDQEDGFSILVDNKRLLKPMPVKCFIRPFKIQNLNENEIDRKISAMNPDYLKEIIEKIKSFIDIKK